MSQDLEAEIAKLRILVVDDMEAMVQMEASCLRDMGFQHVHMEKNGEKAWNYLNAYPVDLVICDWDMPHLNGLQLLKRIRGDSNLEHIAFIMVTATADGGAVKQAITDGVNDYLVKPFQPRELGYRVLKILNKRKTASECS